MSQLKQTSLLDSILSTIGKFKMERRLRWHYSLAKLTFWSFVFLSLIFIFFFLSPSSSSLSSDPSRWSLWAYSWAGPAWEKQVQASAKVRACDGISMLATGTVRFIWTHISTTLKRCGDGIVGLDSFKDYYDPSLKCVRQALLECTGVFIVQVCPEAIWGSCIFPCVWTTPKRTCGRLPWPHKVLLRWTRGTSHPMSGRPQGTCPIDTWHVPPSV